MAVADVVRYAPNGVMTGRERFVAGSKSLSVAAIGSPSPTPFPSAAIAPAVDRTWLNVQLLSLAATLRVEQDERIEWMMALQVGV